MFYEKSREGIGDDCQSITRSSGPVTAGKREIWRHCHRGNNKRRKMEAGTVVIDSGYRKNRGCVLFIFITVLRIARPRER